VNRTGRVHLCGHSLSFTWTRVLLLLRIGRISQRATARPRPSRSVEQSATIRACLALALCHALPLIVRFLLAYTCVRVPYAAYDTRTHRARVGTLLRRENTRGGGERTRAHNCVMSCTRCTRDRFVPLAAGAGSAISRVSETSGDNFSPSTRERLVSGILVLAALVTALLRPVLPVVSRRSSLVRARRLASRLANEIIELTSHDKTDDPINDRER